MALKRVALEIGMGTDIRGGDYTKAAVRALRDALWHNSLTVASAVGKSLSEIPEPAEFTATPSPTKPCQSIFVSWGWTTCTIGRLNFRWIHNSQGHYAAQASPAGLSATDYGWV